MSACAALLAHEAKVLARILCADCAELLSSED
jgi:hypothetical protein